MQNDATGIPAAHPLSLEKHMTGRGIWDYQQSFSDIRYLSSLCGLMPLSTRLASLLLHDWLSTKLQQKHIHFSPSIETSQSTSLCILLLISSVSTSFPASAYQWRWVWEQRQRSSGTVSGSCRLNALGCCGWSGIRGQGGTWANQHADRGWQRADLDTSSEKRPNPNVVRVPERKKETHTKTNTTKLQ